MNGNGERRNDDDGGVRMGRAMLYSMCHAGPVAINVVNTSIFGLQKRSEEKLFPMTGVNKQNISYNEYNTAQRQSRG